MAGATNGPERQIIVAFLNLQEDERALRFVLAVLALMAFTLLALRSWFAAVPIVLGLPLIWAQSRLERRRYEDRGSRRNLLGSSGRL